MVTQSPRSRRRPASLWRRFRYLIRRPGDSVLSLQLLIFIWSAPRRLSRMPLPDLLQSLRSASRPSTVDWRSSCERIDRLSRPWFRLPVLRNHNTCYLRSLMYYRFLDAGDQSMQIHFVVEPPRTAEDRLRGHAWVTVGDEVIEPPLPAVLERARAMYTHPPSEV